MTDSSSTSSSPPGKSLFLQNNPHLALFQTMAQTLRRDPHMVVARLSMWLADKTGPRLWAPFALSLRGFAYEVMDEVELAQMDYSRGLRLYDMLVKELGVHTLKRLENNVNFMRIRMKTLPPIVRPRHPDFVVIGEDGPLL